MVVGPRGLRLGGWLGVMAREDSWGCRIFLWLPSPSIARFWPVQNTNGWTPRCLPACPASVPPPDFPSQQEYPLGPSNVRKPLAVPHQSCLQIWEAPRGIPWSPLQFLEPPGCPASSKCIFPELDKSSKNAKFDPKSRNGQKY